LRQGGVADRLEQVIGGGGLERRQRVLVVSGDEDHPAAARRLRHLQPVQARHADVEKGEIRLQPLQRQQRLHAVRRAGGDGEFRPQPVQALRQVLRQQRFVVGNQGGGHVQASTGRVSSATTPRGWLA